MSAPTMVLAMVGLLGLSLWLVLGLAAAAADIAERHDEEERR